MGMAIHPTAIIHPDAQIADDAEIGPYVCIEGPAIIGPGCVLLSHAVLSGDVRLGKNNRIGYGTIIGSWPQDLSFKPERRSGVVLGDDNTIREHCTIHRASVEGASTKVGDSCFLMAGAHLGHDTQIGDHVIIANNSLLAGHVRIGDRVFIGGGSVFHQFARVGRLAMVQGISGVGKDVPPFTMAAEINRVAGLNVVGMRRAGFNAAQRQEIKEAFHLLYRSGYNTTQALEKAREREWGEPGREFFDFVAGAKKRGICALLRNAASEPDKSD